MKANNYISKKEHRLLLIIAFVAMMFVLSSFISEGIKSYNISVSENQQKLENLANGYPPVSFPTYNDYSIAGFHLLIVFIFASLLITKRFLLPFFLTIFYAACLSYSVPARFDAKRLGSEEFSPHVNFIKKIYFEADSFDYVAAFFILILLAWQLSILLRIFNKFQQYKNVLP